MIRQKCLIPLPHDLDAEKTIIGALITGNYDVAYVCSEIGSIRNFYMEEHIVITDTILDMLEKNIPICKRNVIINLDTSNIRYNNVKEHLYIIHEITIQESELAILCSRVRDCAMAREFIQALSGYSQRLSEGDIDAITFLQLTHLSLFRGIDIFMKPALAGFDTCEIMNHLPELANTEGWYNPLIKCLQARWKKEGEQITDSHG